MKMSLVCFDKTGEIEFTFEEGDKFVNFTLKASEEIIEKVSEIVMPCVYHDMEVEE